MRRATIVTVSAFLILALMGAMPPAILADPGGDDAEDSPENATRVQEGSFEGTLTMPGDSDWYQVDAEDDRAICIEAVIGGDIASEVTVAEDASLERTVTRSMEAGKYLQLALALPASTGPLVGLNPSGNLLDMGGDYTVDVDLVRVSDVLNALKKDGGNPSDDGAEDAKFGDASDDPDDPTPLENLCTFGYVSTKSSDPMDAYSFRAEADDLITLSLVDTGDEDLLLRLISPDGETVTTLVEDTVKQIEAQITGNWTITLEASSSGSNDWIGYATGITINGPEPAPCRPSCFDAQ